jgi:hypothetical protein
MTFQPEMMAQVQQMMANMSPDGKKKMTDMIANMDPKDLEHMMRNMPAGTDFKQASEQMKILRAEEMLTGKHGIAHVQKEEYTEALKLFEPALENLKPHSGDADINVLRHALFVNAALCHLKLKSNWRAKETCDEALAINDKSVKALSQRGLALFALGFFSAALTDLKKASSLSPNDAIISSDLTRLIEEVRQQTKAAGSLQEAESAAQKAANTQERCRLEAMGAEDMDEDLRQALLLSMPAAALAAAPAPAPAADPAPAASGGAGMLPEGLLEDMDEELKAALHLLCQEEECEDPELGLALWFSGLEERARRLQASGEAPAPAGAEGAPAASGHAVLEAPARKPVWSTRQTHELRPEKHRLYGSLRGVRTIAFEKVSTAVAALTRRDSTGIPDDVYKEGYCVVFHKERKKHYLIFRSDVVKVVEEKFNFDFPECLP